MLPIVTKTSPQTYETLSQFLLPSQIYHFGKFTDIVLCQSDTCFYVIAMALELNCNGVFFLLKAAVGLGLFQPRLFYDEMAKICINK